MINFKYAVCAFCDGLWHSGYYFRGHTVFTLNIRTDRRLIRVYIVHPVIGFESAHDETYNKTCATSENSDQPAHPRSLISFR